MGAIQRVSASRRAAVVLLNPAAGAGSAPERFGRLAPALAARHPGFRLIVLDREGRWRARVVGAAASGSRLFIAAGGDGTVNSLVCALRHATRRCEALTLADLTLGAIGLGSSNDFHKPRAERVDGVAWRVCDSDARPRDVVDVECSALGHGPTRRVFVMSASLGVTARANARFNALRRGAARGLLAWLGRRHVPTAIVLSALGAIVEHRDIAARLELSGDDGDVAVDAQISNLNLLKTPHLAGGLRYDTPVAPADGTFAVNLCHEMTRGQLVVALAALARGRFVGRPRTRHLKARRTCISAPAPFDLELDGELLRVSRATFATCPERIWLCR